MTDCYTYSNIIKTDGYFASENINKGCLMANLKYMSYTMNIYTSIFVTLTHGEECEGN